MRFFATALLLISTTYSSVFAQIYDCAVLASSQLMGGTKQIGAMTVDTSKNDVQSVVVFAEKYFAECQGIPTEIQERKLLCRFTPEKSSRFADDVQWRNFWSNYAYGIVTTETRELQFSHRFGNDIIGLVCQLRK